jgi:hypothetical protein
MQLSNSKKTQHFCLTNIKWLALFKEIFTVYSENYMKPICSGKIVELLLVQTSGTFSYHWRLIGYNLITKLCSHFFISTCISLLSLRDLVAVNIKSEKKTLPVSLLCNCLPPFIGSSILGPFLSVFCFLSMKTIWSKIVRFVLNCLVSNQSR